MLIVYDTETTGLVKHPDAPLTKQPRLIEFGAAAINNEGEVVGRIKQLVNPCEPLTDEITKITGITDDDLKDQPIFETAWKNILTFLIPGTTLLAHNEPFDRAIVDYELKRAGKLFAWPETFCTISLYRERWGRDMKLVELYAHVMGRELDQKHRASSDVDALVEIVQKEKIWKVFA